MHQEVPNLRALKVPTKTTDLGISLLARKSRPAFTIAPRWTQIVLLASMQPMIWVASAKRLLGRSAGGRLRRKCNRIGSPARQAFRSRTISASPTFSNASLLNRDACHRVEHQVAADRLQTAHKGGTTPINKRLREFIAGV